MHAINSNAVADINHMIGPNNKIINLEVRNKWLVATLASGVYFWVKNK